MSRFPAVVSVPRLAELSALFVISLMIVTSAQLGGIGTANEAVVAIWILGLVPPVRPVTTALATVIAPLVNGTFSKVEAAVTSDSASTWAPQVTLQIPAVIALVPGSTRIWHCRTTSGWLAIVSDVLPSARGDDLPNRENGRCRLWHILNRLAPRRNVAGRQREGLVARVD